MTADPFSLDFAPIISRFGELSERVGVVVAQQRPLWGRQRSSWAVLPWAKGDTLFWIVVAADAEAERRAREAITAFVGPGVGSTAPRRLTLDPSHAADRELLDRNIEKLFTIAIGSSPGAVLEALELLVAVRADEPNLERRMADPIGFLLRDFYLALSARDAEGSSSLLHRIEATGLLARENIRFLWVERLARLGRWDELSNLPWFVELARARRPRHVTEHMLEALWRRELASAELAIQPGAVLRRFMETDLGNRFKPLIDSVDLPASVEGRRLAFVASTAWRNEDRANRIFEASTSEDEQRLLRQLVEDQTVSGPVATYDTPHQKARFMFEEGDFVGVVEYVEGTSPEPDLVAIAVRSAFELSDPQLALRAMALVSLVEEQSLPATPGFLRSLNDVKQLASDRCASWSEWFVRVAADDAWPDAAQVARAESSRWDVSELKMTAAAEAAANSLVAASEGVNGSQVRATLDLLCDLASPLSQSVGSAALTDALLLVLSMEENPSAMVRNAFFGLLADALASGPPASRYGDLTKTAGDLWQRARSREAVNWALDVCDLLNSHASPDPAARIAFISAVGVGVADFANRLTPDERKVLEALAEEAGTSVALPPVSNQQLVEAEADLWSSLDHRLVGLYSLLGAVGPRFSARVMQLSTSALVEHNADTVATDSLRRLAESADFLVVDTRHAAHAATVAIDQVRPRHQQIFPSGRGVSSFIAALRESLERGTSQKTEPAA